MIITGAIGLLVYLLYVIFKLKRENEELYNEIGDSYLELNSVYEMNSFLIHQLTKPNKDEADFWKE